MTEPRISVLVNRIFELLTARAEAAEAAVIAFEKDALGSHISWFEEAKKLAAAKVAAEARIKLLEQRLREFSPHNEHSERWAYLMSLKRPDAIGEAFALLEESFLHHMIERDGWHPSDTCYMETTQKARKLIEDEYVGQAG